MQLAVEMWPCFDVGDRAGRACAIACRKSCMWPRIGGRDVLLQVLLGLVLGILVQLVGHVAVDRARPCPTE